MVASAELCRINGNQIETGWRNNSMKEMFYSYATEQGQESPVWPVRVVIYSSWIPEQDIVQNMQILKDKRLENSSAAFYNGYINDGFYITDSRIRRKRPCSLNENEFAFPTTSCSRIGYTVYHITGL